MKPDQLPSFRKAESIQGGVFVEIGTLHGGFSYHLLAETSCKKLYCIDPYKHFDSEEYKDNLNSFTQQQFDEEYEKVQRLFEKFGDRVEFLRLTSSEAVALFEDNSLDFVYIDGNHDFKYVDKDIQNWYPKVKVGGYLCGDDVYSLDLNEHGEDKNVFRTWEGGSWGRYGTYTACLENEARYGIKFTFEETQFSVQKSDR